VHATDAEAREEVLRMLEVYRDFVENELAIPVFPGKKSDAERFAGAEETYTIEALMKDGKALQAGTSHHLGQHFAKVFNIQFQSQAGQLEYAWQTSWGVSTRLIGALVMVHGDDAGLRLPPQVAPIQAVVVPIWRKDEERAAVLAFVDRLKAELGGRVRLHVDDRDEKSPGWKYNEYEMRGVPVRLEVGPKDVAKEAVMTVRRDTRAKESVPIAAIGERLPAMLADIQSTMFQQALEFRTANTVSVRGMDELVAHFEAGQRGFVAVPWDGSATFEREVKDRTGATLRCVPFDQARFADIARDGHRIALFARSY
jgi:prolyl-tRNA synthetase